MMTTTPTAPPTAAARTPFFSDLWLLLTLRWQLAWNSFRARKWWAQLLQLLGTLWLAGSVGVGATFVGIGAGVALRRSDEPVLDGLLPGLILSTITLFVLLSSFGIALGALFLSNDLETLMTAPVSRRAVFVAKIFDGVTVYYAGVLAAALPCLIAYGIARRYGLFYFVLAIIAALGTPLFPAGLGALLTMVVARFAPARRVREVLALVGAIFGISCSLLGQTSRLWGRRLGAIGDDPRQFIAQLEALAQLPIPPLVAGRGLAAAGEGHWGRALLDVTSFFVLTLGSFALTTLLAERLYATGWARLQSSGTANRSRPRSERAGTRLDLLSNAPHWLAIAWKDWRVLPRDLRNFAQFLSPLIILPIIYFNLLGGTGRRGRDIGTVIDGLPSGTFDPVGIVIAGGVLTSAVLVFRRIASVGISMEGKSWWLLKSAPISGWELLRGKLVAVLVPFALLSTLLMLGAALWRQFSLFGTLYGWFGIQLLGMMTLAIAVGSAVPWAKLDWDDPRRMSSGWGGLLSFIATGVASAFAGGFLCLPILTAAFQPSLTPIAWVIGPLGAVAIAASAGWGALWLGVRLLDRVGES